MNIHSFWYDSFWQDCGSLATQNTLFPDLALCFTLSALAQIVFLCVIWCNVHNVYRYFQLHTTAGRDIIAAFVVWWYQKNVVYSRLRFNGCLSFVVLFDT